MHSKPAQQLKAVLPSNATRSGVSSPTPSRALAVDGRYFCLFLLIAILTCYFSAAAHSNVIRGPDPCLLRAGSLPIPSNDHERLFLPGTDDEEDQVQEDSVETGRVDEEVVGTDGEDGNIATGTMMDVDDEEGAASDEDSSPIPTLACRLRKPRIEFVFDEVTGDLLESHPTIFLSRPTVPSQSPDLRRSARSCTSPVNTTAAYLQTAHGSKSDATKKKKKDLKGRDQAKMSCKRVRPEDDAAQVKDKPSSKRPKLKETVVIDEDEREFLFLSVVSFLSSFSLAAVATKVVRKRGPGLSKPPPVTLGVSGGGFGEKVPSSATVVTNGIKSIGVLVVDKDFGDFVEIDKSYWSKAVAPFVGERVRIFLFNFCIY